MENNENQIVAYEVNNMNYPLISPDDFEKNYQYGLANASPYIETKTIGGKAFHYLSWSFVMYWLGTHYPHIQIGFDKETGDENQGYYVNAYLWNTLNNFKSEYMELAILDFKNKVICKGNSNNKQVTASDIANTRQRARVKIVATYLGMGLHLYQGYGDVLDDSSTANEEVKQQAEEAQQENEKKKEIIDKILNFADRLQKPELEDYVEPKLVDKATRNELNKYDMSILEERLEKQQHYYGTCKLEYLLEQYKQLFGEEHELSKEDLSTFAYKQLVQKGKELNNLIQERKAPGNE